MRKPDLHHPPEANAHQSGHTHKVPPRAAFLDFTNTRGNAHPNINDALLSGNKARCPMIGISPPEANARLTLPELLCYATFKARLPRGDLQLTNAGRNAPDLCRRSINA